MFRLALIILMSFAMSDGYCGDKTVEVYRELSKQLGRTIEGIREIENPRMWEVTLSGRVIYVDPDLNFAFVGPLLDLKHKKNRTKARLDEIARAHFANLPFDSAIVSRHGNGQATLVVFADPLCKFCRQLEADLDGLEDVTIYTFVLGILSEESLLIARDIWCSENRNLAWSSLMRDQKRPLQRECPNPNERVLITASYWKVTATPTLLFQDGTILRGWQSIALIREHLRRSQKQG